MSKKLKMKKWCLKTKKYNKNFIIALIMQKNTKVLYKFSKIIMKKKYEH
jgi:hypothetical protein